MLATPSCVNRTGVSWHYLRCLEILTFCSRVVFAGCLETPKFRDSTSRDGGGVSFMWRRVLIVLPVFRLVWVLPFCVCLGCVVGLFPFVCVWFPGVGALRLRACILLDNFNLFQGCAGFGLCGWPWSFFVHVVALFIAGGHTASNAPDLFRPPKLSGAGPG